ncbi:CDGSH iron-sulfur domain-containing protein [Candidatus Magnetaquicoccus inordinatus]|uniref:CDGSH iron-sulfur domain-containing protein n=1 Tax=Candidatus Magnetaquicoccus inordinatus TaxID=2496818 RepID=UPI00102CFE75|nr:CDGSH iron-sulfur domain-containing protein [Candidatus Magnetaquicoccus inordinatus]
MSTPLILDLPAGEHEICLCGRSKQEPYCDGSHQGSRSTPRKVVLQAAARVAICTCRKTASAPYCDGSHE